MDEKLVTMDPASMDTTPPPVQNLDMSVKGGPVPHPGFNGRRIKPIGGNAIYFVWKNGYKCWIPNPATYDNLFRSWGGILELSKAQVDAIATGPNITPGAIMARGHDQAAVYFVSNQTKNWVTSPVAMDYCHFKWPNPTVPPVLLEFIPDGHHINYGV